MRGERTACMSHFTRFLTATAGAAAFWGYGNNGADRCLRCCSCTARTTSRFKASTTRKRYTGALRQQLHANAERWDCCP